MDRTLSTIYLKVKSETKTLAKSAIAQVLVKILFSKESRLSLGEVITAYKDFTRRHQVDERAIEDILEMLCGKAEIKKSPNNEYYLTPSRRKEIQDCCDQSTKRIDRIIDTYFNIVHSPREVIKEWLQDVSIHFFRYFSDEWVADLLKTSNAVIHSRNSIHDIIEKRTKDIKGVDLKDYQDLPNLFYKFICSKDPDVMAYMWEYGTSAFSAKLISNTAGVDKLTLDVFNNARCLLDTNILMFIKLESSKYHNALISLENSFVQLGIEVGVLYITKKEFENKIDHQRQLTIKNLEHYGYEITSNADDDFIKSALSLNCFRAEDFETFFEKLRQLPEQLNNSLPIEVIDNEELANAINNGQSQEKKKKMLNNIYLQATGHNKRSGALAHDVGIISGAEYLRENDKWFILSEETSINNYSKNKPTINGLPLAIRVETMINVLALNNGGESFDADDYMPLFASIIRNGLQPRSNTYDQADLYAIYELNQQIALLPEEQKKEIVKEIHAKRLKGESEETIKVELERAITRGKMQVSDDLNNTRSELNLAQLEAKRQKDRGDEAIRALDNKIRNDVKNKYWSCVIWKIVLPLVVIPVVTVVMLFIYSTIRLQYDDSGQAVGFAINLIASVCLEIIYWIVRGGKDLFVFIKNKKTFIENETKKRIDEALNNK